MICAASVPCGDYARSVFANLGITAAATKNVVSNASDVTQVVAQVALSLVLLASLSAAVLFWRRGRPYLVVGWLWYLGMLVPVLGLVQAGAQSRADRYTYLPQIGVCLMVAWLSADLFAGWRQRRLWLGGIGALVIVVLIVRARTQTGYWHDSESLWNHTLAVTEENDVANNNLANVLLQKGQTDEAIARYRKAMEIRPDYVDAHNGLGFALLQKGEVDEAMGQFREALNTQPAAAGVHNNFGMALLQVGRVDEAIIHFQKALETDPDLALLCSGGGKWKPPSPITSGHLKSNPTTREPTTILLGCWQPSPRHQSERVPGRSNSLSRRTGSPAAGAW